MISYPEMREALDHIDSSLANGLINQKQAYIAKSKILQPCTPAQFRGPGISQIDGDINRRRKEHEAIRIAQINAELAYMDLIDSAKEASMEEGKALAIA